MKKQILFLFAASALFAACSSDDMPVTNGGGEDNGQTIVDENLPSSVSVATAEGLGMSVGVLDDTEAETRAEAEEDPNYYFDLYLYGGDVWDKWEQFNVKADDFAIRRNGEYLEVTPIKDSEGNQYGAKWGLVKVTREDNQYFRVRIENLDNANWVNGEGKPVDMTFETYLWIENKKALDDGTGGYGELFTWDDKKQWINNNMDDHGVDISQKCSPSDGIFDGNSDPKNEVVNGFDVRYNVYRGLSGRQTDSEGNYNDVNGLGDTPYMKVSIHIINRGDDMPTTIRAIYPSED